MRLRSAQRKGRKNLLISEFSYHAWVFFSKSFLFKLLTVNARGFANPLTHNSWAIEFSVKKWKMVIVKCLWRSLMRCLRRMRLLWINYLRFGKYQIYIKYTLQIPTCWKCNLPGHFSNACPNKICFICEISATRPDIVICRRSVVYAKRKDITALVATTPGFFPVPEAFLRMRIPMWPLNPRMMEWVNTAETKITRLSCLTHPHRMKLSDLPKSKKQQLLQLLSTRLPLLHSCLLLPTILRPLIF